MGVRTGCRTFFTFLARFWGNIALFLWLKVAFFLSLRLWLPSFRAWRIVSPETGVECLIIWRWIDRNFGGVSAFREAWLWNVFIPFIAAVLHHESFVFLTKLVLEGEGFGVLWIVVFAWNLAGIESSAIVWAFPVHFPFLMLLELSKGHLSPPFLLGGNFRFCQI